MPSFTSEKLAFLNAQNIKKIFANTGNVSASVGYVFLGRSYPYANDSNPEGLEDTVFSERQVWDDMIAAKKITGENLQLVIPRYDYMANVKYRQYDDRVIISDLLSANASQNLKSVYVMNDVGEVYLCLGNNNGGLSNTMPTAYGMPQQYLSTNGTIIMPTDGYIWKYLYTVTEQNEFKTNTWIPVPSSTSEKGYKSFDTISVDGEVNTVQVMNVGSGYVDTVIKVLPFGVGSRILTVNSSFFSSQNLVRGMGISGPGIVGDVFIAAIDTPSSNISISAPTVYSGGGSANNYNVYTRIVVQGDGTGTTVSDTVRCSPIFNGNTIEKIIVTEFGKNYTWANVIIYGTGVGASARAIISPKNGHGFNPAEQLGSKSVMISVDIGKIDSDEGGLISNYTSFRQFGLLKDPHIFGEKTPVPYNRANSFVSQTFNITPGVGPSYIPSETVWQGTSERNAFFSGKVNSIVGNEIKLTNVRGVVSNSALLKSISVPNGRNINGISYPTLQPYTGDILHAENILPVYREDGQSENIKFIIKY